MSVPVATAGAATTVPVIVTETGDLAVPVCEACGAPLVSLHDVCASKRHVGTDGSGEGRAVASTVLAARARGAA